MTLYAYADRIAAANDEFRHRGFGGHIEVSERIQARGVVFVIKATASVRADEGFNSETDPHGQHDFGVVTVDGVRVCWKIDYRDAIDPTIPANPASLNQTHRVLTIFAPLEH